MRRVELRATRRIGERLVSGEGLPRVCELRSFGEFEAFPGKHCDIRKHPLDGPTTIDYFDEFLKTKSMIYNHAASIELKWRIRTSYSGGTHSGYPQFDLNATRPVALHEFVCDEGDMGSKF